MRNAGRAIGIAMVVAVVSASVLVLSDATTSSVLAKDGKDQAADAVRFSLFVSENPETGDKTKNENVYCGVAEGGPYELSVAVSAAPVDLGVDPGVTTGLLSVGMQQPSWLGFPEFGVDRFELSVPFNDSYSFELDLAGEPGVDQVIQLSSPPLGDALGGGYPFIGLASVGASKDAVDPFDGDGRTDNFCVGIGGIPDGTFNPENPSTWPTRVGVEYVEGDISTTLAVPDWWVTDGDGSDGGVLAGPFSPSIGGS